MRLKPHIKSVRRIYHHDRQLYVCAMRSTHNLAHVQGHGHTFRAAYNNWLDQMKRYC